MNGMPLRGDRIHRYVNAFCPVCHEERPDRPLAEVQRLSGWLVERDDRIWLERGCATHGLVRTLYDESPEILTYLEQWTAPTKRHEPDVRGNFKSVPAAELMRPPTMKPFCWACRNASSHCSRSAEVSTAARACATRRRTSSMVRSPPLAYFSARISVEIDCGGRTVGAAFRRVLRSSSFMGWVFSHAKAEVYRSWWLPLVDQLSAGCAFKCTALRG